MDPNAASQTPSQGPKPSGWGLFKQCFRTLRGDKEMVLFPLVGGIVSLFAAIIYFIFLIIVNQLLGGALINSDSEGGQSSPLSYLFLFIYYVIQYFILSYFNAGLAAAVMQRYSGQNPTFGSGIRQANQHVGQIFGYSVISATVGVILQYILERLRFGWLVNLIVGTAWSVATIFVIPILVTTKTGPIQGIKESTRVFQQTWGKNVIGWFGFGFVTLIGIIISIVPLILAVALGDYAAFLIGGIVLFLVILLATSLIVSTCTTIFRVSLYHFATSGKLPPGFEGSGLERAVKVK